MIQTVSLQDVLVQGSGHIVSDMGEEKVMLSIRNGKYYNLGEVGGRVWELMAEPVSVHRVIEALMGEYAVERGECEQQVLAFVEMLAAEGLISYGERSREHREAD